MVAIAGEKFKGVKNVTFEIADASHLPYKDGFFDYVVCFGSFPHFDDKLKALKEISRVLNKGGRLFIAHALSSEEIKNHHSKCVAVAYDTIPNEHIMKYLMSEADLKILRLQDNPGIYFLEAFKK